MRATEQCAVMLNVGGIYFGVCSDDLVCYIFLWPCSNQLLSQPTLQMKIPVPVAVSIALVPLTEDPLHRHNVEQRSTHQALWMIGSHTSRHTPTPIMTHYEKPFSETDLRHDCQHIFAHRTLIITVCIIGRVR